MLSASSCWRCVSRGAASGFRDAGLDAACGVIGTTFMTSFPRVEAGIVGGWEIGGVQAGGGAADAPSSLHAPPTPAGRAPAHGDLLRVCREVSRWRGTLGNAGCCRECRAL